MRPTRPHKFFDSRSRAMVGTPNVLPNAVRAAEALVQRTAVRRPTRSMSLRKHTQEGASPADRTNDVLNTPAVLGVDPLCIVPSAHTGYVYALTFMRRDGATLLVSGSGDESVRLWTLEGAAPMLCDTFELTVPTGDAVLALASWENTLVVGKQGGAIDVWDIDTHTPVRTLAAHNDDVLCLQLAPVAGRHAFYSSGADGLVCRWDRYFRCVDRWQAHAGIVQDCALYERTSMPLLATSSDDAVRLWSAAGDGYLGAQERSNAVVRVPATTLLQRLARFIRYKSVSNEPALYSDDENREDARQAAYFLKTTLMELGASDVQLLSAGPGTNPLVLGTFRGGGRRRVLFYGHYDVVPANGEWASDPWELCGRDGYLFGRGVSDNKGPVLAVAYAAAELLQRRALDIDVVMLVEGEQETGSKTFQACLQTHKPLLGPIDGVLVCNSYWAGDQRPCMTVGLRGVIQARVKISAPHAARHSGVDGGAEREPMMDLIKLFATMTDASGAVTLPGFYDDVRPITDEERASYAELAHEVMQTQCTSSSVATRATNAEGLMALWRLPSFTVHQVASHGPGHSTVIPNAVQASLSFRLVPDQSLPALEELLKQDIARRFATLTSTNSCVVDVFHRADWWLGKTDTPLAQALAASIEAEWGEPPMLIREGGSIPGIAILEKELGASAVHLPFGQRSDHAHLSNERIRLVNLEVCLQAMDSDLQKGQAVVRRLFETLGQKDFSCATLARRHPSPGSAA